ncbi:phage tail protein [Crossiella cryophila]|uniref:Phage tail-like protein n=1 Tax=Crossiella cryophila TaxID=43355 RepID=A0A7W7CF84_9PSEU|nr:phage tail protein [Crossiella cryophila]MBB4680010.1 phage tail-like protein [Crossiella cryophila]
MSLASNARLGLAMRFQVAVDGIDLGGWRSCKGLAVTFENETFIDGGNYDAKSFLPKCVDYPPVTLQRAMTAADSARVQQWLAGLVENWVNGYGVYRGGTAQITLLDSMGTRVSSWSLRNVLPRSWRGPELDAKGAEIAIEQLELVHEGFL